MTKKKTSRFKRKLNFFKSQFLFLPSWSSKIPYLRSLSCQKVSLLWCFMSVPCYMERERERERVRQHTKNVANQPNVKIIYLYISYVIHTSLIHFICFYQPPPPTCGLRLQVWQQQASRKQQIGCPCVLPIKTKNAINMIIKAFRTNFL